MNKTLRQTGASFSGALLIATTLGVSTATAQSNVVRIYDNPNFGGQEVTLRGDTPDLRPFNMNDRVTSIEIPEGQAWEVCQDVDYGNQCQVLTSSVADLRAIGWNDRISSLRRVGNARGYRNRPY